MFDDPKGDLKRMEQELLSREDESWLDRELADARRLLEEEEPDGDESFFRDFSQDHPGSVTNNDRVDVDLDAYSDDLLEAPPVKREKGIRGLLILIVLELLGIASIGVYWLVQLS